MPLISLVSYPWLLNTEQAYKRALCYWLHLTNAKETMVVIEALKIIFSTFSLIDLIKWLSSDYKKC